MVCRAEELAEGSADLHTVSSSKPLFGLDLCGAFPLNGCVFLLGTTAAKRFLTAAKRFQPRRTSSSLPSASILDDGGAAHRRQHRQRPRLRRGRRPLRPLPEMDARVRSQLPSRARTLHRPDALRPPRRRGGGGLVAPARRALHAQGDRRLAAHLARGVGRRPLRPQRARRLRRVHGADDARAAPPRVRDVAAVGHAARAALECAARIAQCRRELRAPPPRIARAPPPPPELRLAHSPHPSARAAFFLGGVPVLKHKELVASPVDRFRLQTEPSGVVQINVGVVVKDFKKYGVSVS